MWVNFNWWRVNVGRRKVVIRRRGRGEVSRREGGIVAEGEGYVREEKIKWLGRWVGRRKFFLKKFICGISVIFFLCIKYIDYWNDYRILII